jgi:hypothetical protein
MAGLPTDGDEMTGVAANHTRPVDATPMAQMKTMPL